MKKKSPCTVGGDMGLQRASPVSSIFLWNRKPERLLRSNDPKCCRNENADRVETGFPLTSSNKIP